ncbi:MAG: ribosome maturation factor RimM [Woeseiaceae bacterium]|nr:ribosome maturation factor RimM [Woeseiaceae bacterium]
MPGDDTVVLGRISGLFGVRGWIKVYSYTDPREAILDYSQWWLGQDDDWFTAELTEGKRQGKTVIAHLSGYDDPDQAATLLGRDVIVPRSALPLPDKDTYYWSDLEGLRVIHRDGTDLGTVAYVLETGANDVLVTSGDKERLIPFIVGEVILNVDLANGEISVDWDWD